MNIQQITVKGKDIEVCVLVGDTDVKHYVPKSPYEVWLKESGKLEFSISYAVDSPMLRVEDHSMTIGDYWEDATINDTVSKIDMLEYLTIPMQTAWLNITIRKELLTDYVCNLTEFDIRETFEHMLNEFIEVAQEPYKIFVKDKM